MINVSAAFKNMMSSNVRPNCGIKINVIDVSGTEANPIETLLFSWTSSEISDLKFTWEIDPFCRALPHIELQWREIYNGKLTEDLYPEKYQNVFPYLSVDIEFIQDLDFFATWKTLKDSGTTWKDIVDAQKTWKQIKKEVPFESVKMPRLFLRSKPVYERNTVIWEAADCLSFLEDPMTGRYYDVSLINIIPAIMIVSSSFYFANQNLHMAYDQTRKNIEAVMDAVEIGKSIIYQGKTNELLMNYASVFNRYIKFHGDGSFTFANIGFAALSDTDYHFKEKLLYDNPTTTRGTNISAYTFDRSRISLDTANKYRVEEYDVEQNVAVFRFKGYGTCLPSDNTHIVLYGDDTTYAITDISSDPNLMFVIVTPINIVADTFSQNVNSIGDVYEEKNPLNPYDLTSQYVTNRIAKLNEYFKNEYSTFEFSCLPNVALEPTDVVEVDTLFFDDEGQRIEKQAMICKVELSYNGALREKIIAHEVSDIGKG